jgi:hypothetical protein
MRWHVPLWGASQAGRKRFLRARPMSRARARQRSALALYSLDPDRAFAQGLARHVFPCLSRPLVSPSHKARAPNMSDGTPPRPPSVWAKPMGGGVRIAGHWMLARLPDEAQDIGCRNDVQGHDPNSLNTERSYPSMRRNAERERSSLRLSAPGSHDIPLRTHFQMPRRR